MSKEMIGLRSSDGKIRVRVDGEVWAFTVKQWIWIGRIVKGEDEDKVASELGITRKEVGKWLKDERVTGFIGLMMKAVVIGEIYDEKVWKMRMVEIFEDEGVSMKNRIEAGKELGARVAPKVERV